MNTLRSTLYDAYSVFTVADFNFIKFHFSNMFPRVRNIILPSLISRNDF